MLRQVIFCFDPAGIIGRYFLISYLIKMILCAFKFKSLWLWLHEHSRVLCTGTQMNHKSSWEESRSSTEQKWSVLSVKHKLMYAFSLILTIFTFTFCVCFLMVYLCTECFWLSCKRVFYCTELLHHT